MVRSPQPGLLLAAVGGIYAAQSVVGGLTFQAAPTVMRAEGYDRHLIGFVWALMLFQALKFLWAPAIERLRQGPDGRRHSRTIILAGQVLTVATLYGLSWMTGPLPMLGMLALATLLTATIDIACDAMAVEQFGAGPAEESRWRSWGNVMQVGGAYLGMLLGGGLLLYLWPTHGWGNGIVLMAGAVAILSVPLLFVRERPMPPSPSPVRPGLGKAFSRPEMRIGIAVVALMQPGIRIALGMLGPFLVDRGFAVQNIGLLTGVGGTLAGFAGTIIGGIVIGPAGGAARLLRPILVLQAILFAALLVSALLPKTDSPAIAVLILLMSLTGGASFVILYTAMMGWSDGGQPGIDFSLLQCTDATLAAIFGILAGFLAEFGGYGSCFGVAAALAGIGAAVIPFLLQGNALAPATEIRHGGKA